MNITIDLQGMQTPDARNRGIGRYSSSLVLNFLKIAESHSITLLYNRNFACQDWLIFANQISNYTNVRMHGWSPFPNTSYLSGDQSARHNSAELYVNVIELLETDVLLVLSPFTGFSCDSIYSTEGNYHSIAIFYDAIPKIFSKQYLADENVLKWYTETVEVLRSFNGIAAISESSLHDMKEYLNILSSQNVVLNCGIDSRFTINNSESECKKPYLLSVLGEDPRKNKIGLLKAFKMLKDEYGLNLDLKIVYKQSEYEKIANVQILSKMGLTENVEFTDYVDDLKLARMYGECSLFVFPSLYEGLGLPLLEAISSGALVVTGDNSSLKEIITEPELLFDSEDPKDIAKTIYSILKNEFAELIKKIVKERIVAKYQWQSAANDLLKFCNLINAGEKRIVDDSLFSTIAWVAPGPGEASGISDYSYEMVKVLSEVSKVDWFCENLDLANREGQDLIKAGVRYCPLDSKKLSEQNYDVIIYNFGNSKFHLQELSVFKANPGIVILHDFYLSGLYWSQYSGKLELENFQKQAKEISGENVKFLRDHYPPHSLIADHTLNEEIVELATAIVVHSEAAKEMVLSRYHLNKTKNKESLLSLEHLRSLNYEVIHLRETKKKVDSKYFLVGVFGIVSETKYFNEILLAWMDFNSSSLGKLYFIGDYDESLKVKINEHNLAKSVVLVGRVNRTEYNQYLAKVDVAVQLRKVWKGETSGAVLDTIASGIPTITNDIGSFSEITNSVVVKLPAIPTVTEITNALKDLYSNNQKRSELAANSIQYILERHNPQHKAEKLFEFIKNNGRQKKYIYAPGSISHPNLVGISEDEKKEELHHLFNLTKNTFIRKNLLIDLDLFRRAGITRNEIAVAQERILRSLDTDGLLAIRYIDSGIMPGLIAEVHDVEAWNLNSSIYAGVRQIVVNFSDLLITHKELEVLCKQIVIDEFVIQSGNLQTIIDKILSIRKTVN